jgi:hypothetical protein
MRLAPPLSTGDASPPDDVDSLLQAYFRAEMPEPWPAPPRLQPILVATATPVSSRGLNRSRLALAASVAILIGGTLALPRPSATGPAAPELPPMGPGEATRLPLTATPHRSKGKPANARPDVAREARPEK